MLLAGRPLDSLDAFGAIRSLLDSPPTHVAVPAILWEADAWLALGEPDRSRAALDRPAAEGVPDASVARARLELAEGDPEAALRQLDAFRRAEAEPFMPFAVCQAFAVEALAKDALRDEPAALLALERCLDVAEPRGQGTVLLDFGASLRSLLRRAIARGTSHRSLADELLAALEGESVLGRRADSAAARAAQRAGARGPALPADDALERRDRIGDVRLSQHGEDSPEARVPQARRSGPQAGGAPRSGAPVAGPGPPSDLKPIIVVQP